MAIRNNVNRICILTQEDASRFASTGDLPPHKTHRHCGRHLAEQMTRELQVVAQGRRIYAASWIGPGKKAIQLHEPRSWKKVTSFGYGVMQFVL